MNKRTARQVVVMLRCRAYGHVWDDQGWLAMTSQGVRLWAQRFHCDRCTADRDDHRSHGTLTLVRRWYSLPDSYPGRMPKADALAILIKGKTDSQRLALWEQSPFAA